MSVPSTNEMRIWALSAVACGFSEELPVGMLLTGPVNGDERLLQTAHAVEQAMPDARRRPPMP